MRFFLVLSLYLINGVLSQQTCDYPYVYVNVGPNTASEDVRFGCTDLGGCEVAYSSGACGCDPNCAGFVSLGPPLDRGEYNTTTITGWGIGDLLCSTGQISAIHSLNYELAPAKIADSKYIFTHYRNSAGVTCQMTSLSEGSTVVNVSTNGGTPTVVTLTGKYDTGEATNLGPVTGGSGSAGNVITITSTNPFVVGCYLASNNNDFSVLLPLSTEPLYGWVSKNARGVHVDCSTLATASAYPTCTASSDETATSGFTVDSNTPESPFASIFGYRQTASAQDDHGPPAFECHSDEGKCLFALSVADSFGNECSSWIPSSAFSDYFVVLDTMIFSSALSIGTAICTKNGATWITTSGTSLVKYASGGTLAAGDILSCDEPISLILQRNPDEKEMNYYGFQLDSTWDAVKPTCNPTSAPTQAPTTSPTKAPTTSPTKAPTTSPTKAPTTSPTKAPTTSPTKAPTTSPTKAPTKAPTTSPTGAPTRSPTVPQPTKSPTSAPTSEPTFPQPTGSPTVPLDEEGLSTGAVVGAVAGAVGAAGVVGAAVFVAIQSANAAGGAAAASGNAGGTNATFPGGLETAMSPDGGAATAGPSPAPPGADMVVQPDFFPTPTGGEAQGAFSVDASNLFVEEALNPNPSPSTNRMRRLLNALRRSTAGGSSGGGVEGLL